MVRAFSPESYFANFLGRCPKLVRDGPLVLSRTNPNRIGLPAWTSEPGDARSQAGSPCHLHLDPSPGAMPSRGRARGRGDYEKDKHPDQCDPKPDVRVGSHSNRCLSGPGEIAFEGSDGCMNGMDGNSPRLPAFPSPTFADIWHFRENSGKVHARHLGASRQTASQTPVGRPTP